MKGGIMGIGGPGGDGGRDRGRVLIVASSPINRIVISHTIERIYLKPTAVAPEAAAFFLPAYREAMLLNPTATCNLDRR